MAYCIKCGKETDDGKTLCDNCAAELNKPDEEQSAAEQSKPEPDDADNTEKKPGRLKRLISGITGNKKRLLIIIGALVLAAVIAVVILFLTHVLCIHKWSAATCTQPEICSICDRTQGTPLGHKNDPATCTEDAVCTVCGETVEKAFGHDWTDATCTEPETCSVCGEISGKALGHDWLDATCTTPITCKRCEDTRGTGRHHWELATCTEPKTCTRCGETEGEKLGHDWKDATCTKPQTCRRCDKTKGEAAGHDWVDATFTEPKTCKVCEETEGEPDYIGNYSPYEIMAMGVTKSEFIEATGDAYHFDTGCDACAYSPDNLSTSVFPGCSFAFHTKKHFHVGSGSISASTYVGMSYSALVNALGEPEHFGTSEMDGDLMACYTLPGAKIYFKLSDFDLYNQFWTYKIQNNIHEIPPGIITVPSSTEIRGAIIREY